MTDIVFVLDRSGSMESIKEATIQGFNQFLHDQKIQETPARMTLVQFDDQYDVVAKDRPIRLMDELNTITFMPRGNTALLDAIGRTINSHKNSLNRVLFVILTDGHENCSKEFTVQKINDMIAERRRAGWAFTFLGANQDAITTAGQLGIAGNAAITYNANKVATANAIRSLSNATKSYREDPTSYGLNYTAQDRHYATSETEFLPTSGSPAWTPQACPSCESNCNCQ